MTWHPEKDPETVKKKKKKKGRKKKHFKEKLRKSEKNMFKLIIMYETVTQS